ncbi:MAG: CoA-binding protein [Ignavibacteriaceae bacterium]|nr:CoA-binding protein [Ignavibacteriaceae bacterium]
MKELIREFVESRNTGLVGVSKSGKKFGFYAMNELNKRGFEVFPVHNEITEMEGVAFYKSIEEISGLTKNLVIIVNPSKTESIIVDAANAGIKNIWIQQGAESPAAIEKGKQLGLNVVHGKCILMYSEPVKGFHKFHKVIADFFDKS